MNREALKPISVFLAVAAGTAATVRADDTYERPSAAEALEFLQSLPPIHRKVDGNEQYVQMFADKTVQDIKTTKTLQFGGHVKGGGHTHLKGEDWKYLTAFEQVEKANLWEIEGADDEAFYHLGHLSQSVTLLYIEVAHEVTAKGVKHLRRLKNLQTLGIGWSNGIDDEAVRRMAELSGLVELNVSGCRKIKGPGLAALAKLKHLKTLRLSESALKDDGLAYLKQLGVKELDLSKPPGWVKDKPYHITSAGLRSLLSTKESVPNLEKLTLRHVPLSDEQLEALKKLRPGLKIVR